MSLQHLIVLLPCHSLEDLSLDRDAREAEQLLAAWSALFHPAILSSAGSVPKWERADLPPKDPADSLIVLPECSRATLPDDWLDEARAAGACVIQDFQSRDQIVASALEQSGVGASAVDSQLAGDFLALGFCHFQIELLTRQLRYMSNLDEVQFERETLAAASPALKGDAESAREHLRGAFDLLTESREYFYPVETYLLDFTLVTPTTLGESLRAELAASGGFTNLLISGESVQQMAMRQPDTLAAFKEALEKGKVAIIGGEFDEQELPLLGVEAMLDQFRRGSNSYDRYLGRRPEIFGRRRFGLSPLLPQVLDKLGFSGAVHFTLDEGRFPAGNHSRVRWQGADATAIEALVRLPIDAARHESFLMLPTKLGDVMDLDHAATAVFAHWPGRSTPWYGDLRRMAEYSPVLGRFVSITDYFHNTEHSGQKVRYKADQYRSPYLRQSIAAGQADPISRWIRYHVRRSAADAAETLAALADLAGGGGPRVPAGENLVRAVEDSRTHESDSPGELDDRLNAQLQQATHRLSAALPRENGACEKGLLLTNPWSFARRVCADVSVLDSLPNVEGPVQSAAESAGRKHAIVDVPPMGFAWVGAGSPTAAEPKEVPRKKRWRKKRADEPPMVEGNLLRNEHFEVAVDPITGALESIHDYFTRGNRLSQQIALRLPRSDRPTYGDDADMAYSVMAADEVSVTSEGPLVGEITSRGRLMSREGRRLAGFTQTVHVERGSRVLELTIDLDVDQKPGTDPWDSYYAARFAWGDATADLYRGVSLASLPSEAARIEAPHFVDLRTGKTRTTILTGGLPYHRRFGLRKLDSLLIVGGETARSFRLGIGIDLAHPVPAALDFLAPSTVLAEEAPPPRPAAGWLFHLDARNVVATHWSCTLLGGKVSGYRVRLLETEGRGCRVGLRSFRKVTSARKTDFSNTEPVDLSVEDDRIAIEMGAHEWVQVEASFAG